MAEPMIEALMSSGGRGPCELCGRIGLLAINGEWFCDDHVGEGLVVGVRLLAVERGMDPDQAERMAANALADLLQRINPDLGESR